VPLSTGIDSVLGTFIASVFATLFVLISSCLLHTDKRNADHWQAKSHLDFLELSKVYDKFHPRAKKP
jgi:hypothetical protein